MSRSRKGRTAGKHTPGPWHVGFGSGGDCRIYSDAESHAIARTYGPDLNGIGLCELTGPKNRADARLIAAAPEMLEVLIELSKSFIGTYFDDERSDKERDAHQELWERKARAAIAKATGERA